MVDAETLPLQLSHSWPLFERNRHFALGQLTDIVPMADDPALARRGIGWWECDLADSRLSWTSAVYDIFGLERGCAPARAEAVSLYDGESREKMERLRAHAIRHRRGFTLDAAIRQPSGRIQSMRLIAAPVCAGDRVVRMQGIKIAL